MDAIYIDPPYNTGAKDWKYNNDYVEGDDLYRHSKWLAMMERRLTAREGVVESGRIGADRHDRREGVLCRLGLLLEQTFAEAVIQMVTTIVNPARTPSYRAISQGRRNTSILSCLVRPRIGQEVDPDFGGGSRVSWRTLRRSDASSARGTSKEGPGQFYPIYVNQTE